MSSRATTSPAPLVRCSALASRPRTGSWCRSTASHSASISQQGSSSWATLIRFKEIVMLFSILLGLVPKLGTWFLDYLRKKSDNELEKIKATIGGDVQLNVAELRYKVEVARMAADMRKDDREHWFTAWMVPC